MQKRLLIIALTAVLLLSGCSEYSDIAGESDYNTGIYVTPEVIDSIAAAVSAAQTEKYPRETDVSGNTVVFWVEGGTVWHESRACSSVAKSDSVSSGSREDALAAGKERACLICGDNEE